jgi:hypothetical protein
VLIRVNVARTPPENLSAGMSGRELAEGEVLILLSFLLYVEKD